MVPPAAPAGASVSTNWGTSTLFTRALVKKPFTSTRPVNSTVRLASAGGGGAGGDGCGGGGGGGGGGGVCAVSGSATAISATRSVARISGSWRFRYDYSKLQRSERKGERAE